MALPHLTKAALNQAIISKMARHGRTFLAIYGQGEAGSVPLEGKGTVEVVPVRSELELREKLPPFGQQPYRAYLVPFFGNLPEDIGGRFIANGKIERIGPMQQIAGLTGTNEAEIEACQTKLALYLLRSDNPTNSYPVKGQKTGKAELFSAWLATDWKVPAEGELALDTLLGWAVRDARGSAFEGAMAEAAAEGVQAELMSHLGETLGPLGPLIFQAWQQGRGADLLGFAALAEVLEDEADEAVVELWLRLKLKGLVALPSGVEVQPLVAQLAGLARPVFSWLRRRDEGVIPRVLERAEALVDEDAIRLKLAGSHRLPVAWKLRLEALDQALLLVAKEPDRKSLALAEKAWKELENHEIFTSEDRDTALLTQRAEMALRLAAWLVARPDRAIVVPAHSYGAAEALGTWYVEEGGHLDWARRRVRGLAGSPLSAGAQAVVEAADTERVAMDRRFSEALSSWIHAGRPSKNLLPIDQALERVGARFLKGSEDRSLLVLLMDGMAWTQAVELLPSLADGGRRWGPIAWSESPQHRIGDGRYPVMLAALPSVTEVSRSALFAGKLMKDGANLSTAKDPEHFGANKHMAAFLESHLKPKLMLRGDGHTSDGALTEEARTMIKASAEQRVAAIVVNAIDASLKGDSQKEERWDVESIRSLPQIFEAAREAGRHVLMVADHGHVPADRLKNIGQGNGGGARYRRWSGDTDVLSEGERKFSGEGVFVQKGDTAVVLLEDDGTRYGGAPHAGEHGGAAMAEVIAPCVLLGWEDPLQSDQDQELKVRGLFVPDWWTRSLAEEKKAPIVRSEPTPKRKPKSKVPENQTALFAPAPEAPAEPESAAPPSTRGGSRPATKPQELLPAFYGSEMLSARTKSAEEKKTVVTAVHFLLSRPGGVPASAFASHMNVPPFRVHGLVSTLQEILNLDGYEIISLERQHQTISLNKTRLEQQFEVQL